MVIYMDAADPSLSCLHQAGKFFSYSRIVHHWSTIVTMNRVKKMAKEKAIKVRLNTVEYERLEREATRRDVPMSQIVRELLKTLDKTSQTISS